MFISHSKKKSIFLWKTLLFSVVKSTVEPVEIFQTAAEPVEHIQTDQHTHINGGRTTIIGKLLIVVNLIQNLIEFNDVLIAFDCSQYLFNRFD